ncbi:MAG: sulfatase-like hydrolase/transferase [Phycisphaeraceae bacterium]
MPADRNLLLVFARGLRSDVIGDAQAWPLRTPQLERFARQGLRAVATSACPTDVGGMTSLLTGLHARQHGRTGDGPSQPLANTCLHWLAEAGYHVAGVGAVGAVATALDDAVVVDDVSAVDPSHCAYWQMASGRGLAGVLGDQRRQRLRTGPFEPHRLLLDPEDDIDGYISRQAVAMLDRMPTDKPWAMVVIFTGPGNELPPPTLYEDLVSPAELRTPFVPVDLRQLDALGEPAYPRTLLQRLEPHTLARIRADYLGRVGLLDYAVGRLTCSIAQRRDADRTWTLLSADHGHLLGEHGFVGQRSFLAPAVEVPLLLVPPATAPLATGQVVVDGLVSTVDIAPTIAALGAADAPPNLAGRSLLPMLQGGALPAGDGNVNLSEFGDRLMLETERFKIIFNRVTRSCLGLYDLLNDPDEKQNLADQPRGLNLLDALRLRLVDALLPLRGASG